MKVDADERASIAVTHPGKIGDALYALPTVRHLCERLGTRADFYTSSYCEPLRKLLEHQPYIRRVVVPESYVIERYYEGIQPWKMPVPEGEYDHVVHLGFRAKPDRYLADFIAESVGAPTGLPLHFEHSAVELPREPYVVLAPGVFPDFRAALLGFARRCPLPVVVVGGAGEHLGIGLDKTGLDILDTLPWIRGARLFVGTPSSPLVLANAFPIRKVVCFASDRYDPKPLLHSRLHAYVDHPTGTRLLEQAGFVTLSKGMSARDYEWLGEARFVRDMLARLEGVPYRFDHQHRLWEYGLALRALKAIRAARVLDVGGGGSVFAPAAAALGAEVLEIDPDERTGMVEEQARRLGVSLSFTPVDFFDFESKERFDAVCCLSVIEHVEEDVRFFRKLLGSVKKGGILFLSTDFSESGAPHVAGHLRTYDENGLRRLASLARAEGFEPFGGDLEYSSRERNVGGYNFATLCLERRLD